MKKNSFFLLLLFTTCSAYAQQKDSVKKAAVQLDSITVFHTGYQAVARNRSAGSFSQLDHRSLNLQQGTTVLIRLEGMVPAVALSKKTNSTIPGLSVRGLSTINGPAQPLIILDNFPFEGDLNSLNPNLIESITVLKDATAASIWGTRAGNGVIVIHTKKPQAGPQLQTELFTGAQVSSKPDVYYLHPVSSSDYIDMEQWLFGKGYYTAALNSYNHSPVSPVVELLDQQSRGVISASSAAAAIDQLRNTDARSPYQSNVYQPAVNQQYAVHFTGGSGISSWAGSGGYDHSVGSLAETYERISARIEQNYRPVDRLKINSSLYYTHTYSASGKDGYASQRYLFPYSALTGPDGAALPLALNYRMSYTDTLGKGKLNDWNFYPATDYLHHTTHSQFQHLIANAGLQYQIGKGFSLEGKYQYELELGKADELRDAQSYDARYLVNLFSQLNYANGQVTTVLPPGGILDQTQSSLGVSNTRLQLNYNRTWNLHQLSALAGNETRALHSSVQQYRTYGYDPGNLSTGLVDYRNAYPIITTGDYTYIPYNDNFENKLSRFVSFYGHAAYTYARKYSLNLSARRDASNLFGARTNNKWTPLWSAGVAWNLSDEGFYRVAAIPLLKIRASYGYTGNADPNRSALVTVYSLGNSANTGLTGYRIKQFPNPSLRWEKVAISNFGVDFALNNNRLSGTVEYYTKKGTDLFALFPVDITSGLSVTSTVQNVASMRGQGVDLVLNSVNTRSKLQWRTGLIFSYNRDRVTKASISNPSASNYVNDGNIITAIAGRPVHSLLSYRWAGLDPATGNPQGYLNGKVSTDYAALTGSGSTLSDLDYNGPATPQFFGSLQNSFSYKGLELVVQISYKFAYYFRGPGLNYSSLFAGTDRMGNRSFARRWQQPGDEAFTNVPSMVYPGNANRDAFYNNSSVLVQRGDHIRLQFINLSYSLATGKARRTGQRRLEVFVNASNLGILWRANHLGIDPDYSLTDLPASATFAAGIRLFLQ